MARNRPRIAVRALILDEDRLLLVNACAGNRLGLWCAPGGGVETGTSLVDNLRREVHEECGIDIIVGAMALVNEFHDPASGFHQVEMFFRCSIRGRGLPPGWRDPERIVTERRFFSRVELASGRVRFKPDSLPDAAWGGGGALYDALEELVR